MIHLRPPNKIMHQWLLLVNEDDLVQFVYIAEKMKLKQGQGRARKTIFLSVILIILKLSGIIELTRLKYSLGINF